MADFSKSFVFQYKHFKVFHTNNRNLLHRSTPHMSIICQPRTCHRAKMAVLNDMYSQILKQQLTNNIKVKISEYVFIPAAGITLFSFIVDHPID